MWSYTSCQTYYGLRNVMHVKDFFLLLVNFLSENQSDFAYGLPIIVRGKKKTLFPSLVKNTVMENGKQNRV